MNPRRTSSHVQVASRTASRSRRAPMASASSAVEPSDGAALVMLARHHLAKARGDTDGSRRLSAYAYALRQRGKGQLVQLANRALLHDGGALLRALATVDEPPVQRAVALFLAMVSEHEVRSTAGLALILRSCVQAAALDGALVKVLHGKASAEDTKLAGTLDAPARLNLATGLQLERQAADARSTVPTIDVAARIREVEAQLARERAAEDEDEGGDDANP